MANKNDRNSENVNGKFYVDNSCIGCSICLDEAPENFDLDDYTDSAFIFRQPGSAEEKSACKRAMKLCPVKAIGDDG